MKRSCCEASLKKTKLRRVKEETVATEKKHADTETGLKFFQEVLSFVRCCVGVLSTGINSFAT